MKKILNYLKITTLEDYNLFNLCMIIYSIIAVLYYIGQYMLYNYEHKEAIVFVFSIIIYQAIMDAISYKNIFKK